jgi:sensor histidine kinase regulating citrate/malate metabolism
MQTTNENQRAYRHDMKNHLILLSELAQAENSIKCKKYLQELIGKFENDGVYSATGNIAFDSILNFKLNTAKEAGAEISSEIAVPKYLKMNISDISIIVGNLLDNAIAAVSSTDKKIISVKIKYDKGCLLAFIRNTYNGNVKYENGIIATTNEDKENHGFGLKNIRNAVNKYNGSLEISHTDDVFEVSILLYDQYI